VARLASFQRAAAEVGMSTSAVSHAIRGLEERLGVGLFNRTTRSVALTEAGQRLLERLQPALRDVGDALEEMNNFRTTPSGTLRINTSYVAAQLLITPMLARFLAAYPEIRLEVVPDDGLVDIVAGGFDAGIRFQEDVPEDMVGVRFGGTQRFAVVGAPGYFARHPPPRHPADLARHACIRHRFPSGRIFKWEFERGGMRHDVDPVGPVTLGDTTSEVRAALDGIGLTFAFERLAAAALRDGRLVRVLDDWCPEYPGFMLYYPRQRRMSSALRAFVDLMRAVPPSIHVLDMFL
jgi:DNA-binding transcriptional LysR family regulator